MVKKLIEELSSGEDVRTSAAVVAFDQLGQTETLSTSIRPNPLNTHYVKNQAQLEAALGPDLIIPTNTSVTVVIDESMTLSKPFQKQQDSDLLLKSESSNVSLTYTGIDALIAMENLSQIGKRTQIENLTIVGNGTNRALAIEDSEFFTIDKVIFAFFAKVGFIKGSSVIWNETGTNTVAGGVDFIDNPFIDIDGTDNNNTTPFAPARQTLFNFISTIQTDVIFEKGRHVNPNHADFFVFFDPNSSPDSSFTVRDAGVITTTPQNLFQKGSILAATANASAGIDTQFDIIAHNLVVGQYAVFEGFSGFVEYNGTFKVIAVNDANSVDVAVGFVGVDPSGFMDASSLDATSNRVEAISNPDQADSMTIAEVRTTGTIQVDYGAIGVAVPMVDATPASGHFEKDPATEGFTVDDMTGIVTYDGLEPITIIDAYELIAEPTTGPDQDLKIDLRINGILQTKSDLNLVATGDDILSTSNGKIYKINPGDTFQLFSTNNTNTNSTSFKKVSQVIVR